jgi:hypothetical protein
LAQNGPPGWTSSTDASSSDRRYSNNPALRFGMIRLLVPAGVTASPSGIVAAVLAAPSCLK